MNDANPYNSPTNSTARGNGVADFRVRAVAESARLRSGCSSCKERDPSLAKLREPIKVTVVVSLAFGLTGLVSGGIIGCLLKSNGSGDNPYILGIAAGCSIGGIFFMFLPTWVEEWIVRRFLAPREEGLGAGSKGIHIALENAKTYSSLKLLAEDMGLIYFHPEGQYIKICGLSYDYVIQAKDVAGLALHSNGKTVLLSYMVGNERLDLAIIPRSLLTELICRLFGSSRSLFKRVENALGGKVGA